MKIKKGTIEIPAYVYLMILITLILFFFIYSSEYIKEYYANAQAKSLLNTDKTKTLKILIVYDTKYPYYLSRKLQNFFSTRYRIRVYRKHIDLLQLQDVYTYYYILLYNVQISNNDILSALKNKIKERYNKIVVIGKSENFNKLGHFVDYLEQKNITPGQYILKHKNYKDFVDIRANIPGYSLNCFNSYPSFYSDSETYGCYVDNLLFLGIDLEEEFKEEPSNTKKEIRYLLTFLTS